MKINGSIINRLLLRETSSGSIGSNEKTDSTTGKKAVADGDGAFKLSREAEVLEKALRIMERTSEVDSALVERTAERVRNGSYTVNTADVARKITETLKGE